MSSGVRTLLVGGARSGKSRIGQDLAASVGSPVTVIVTALATDEEMAARISSHRSNRPAGWVTVEAPRLLAEAVVAVPAADVLLVDCLTLWLSNLLVEGVDDPDVETATADLRAAIADRAAGSGAGQTIVVSNEVGMGLVPTDPLSRRFRDAQGRLNQQLSADFERAFFVAAGSLLRLSSPTDQLPELR